MVLRLLGVLVAVFVVVNGQDNPCLDISSEYCAAGKTTVSFFNCGLNDDDFPDIATCLDNIGRGTITDLSFEENSLTSALFSWLDGEGQLLLADLDELKELDLDENSITSIPAGAFAGLGGLTYLNLDWNPLEPLAAGVFAELGMLQTLKLRDMQLGDIVAGTFDGLVSLTELDIDDAGITSIADGAFADLGSLIELDLDINDLGSLSSGVFQGLGMLENLFLSDAGITSLPDGVFAGLETLLKLELNGNQLGAIPSGTFDELTLLESLELDGAGVTSIQGGAFDDLEALTSLILLNNPDLQCIEGFQPGTTLGLVEEVDDTFDVTGECDCDPNDDDSCEGDLQCCPEDLVCKDPEAYTADACGDPHMTGFHGQKFDFTGEDGAWYCLLSDLGVMHLNMRVTAPVLGRPEITYITGLSLLTTDSAGLEHSVVITVKSPHSLQSACPTSRDGSVSPCLADGALSVVLDGQEGRLLEPGTNALGPGVTVDAVNLPGACRSFGFQHYWERKRLEYAQAGRKLAESQSMGEWILSDPTVTNMDECIEYVAREVAGGSSLGLLNHQSEHASFRIVTPKATIRLSHGRLHQTATRDPTDSFDLPEHLTWQMNVAIDQNDVSLEAKGVLGETIVPRRGADGDLIMEGMEAIRGEEQEYHVAGPLEVTFAQDLYHQQ